MRRQRQRRLPTTSRIVGRPLPIAIVAKPGLMFGPGSICVPGIRTCTYAVWPRLLTAGLIRARKPEPG